jgi:Cft2 family RNA processing exonuclease
VGRSCFLLGDGERYVMLDCGISPKTGAMPRFDLLEGKRVVAVLLSHMHLDHTGALPWLPRRIQGTPIHSTRATGEGALVLLRDSLSNRGKRGGGIPPAARSALDDLGNGKWPWELHGYGEEFELDEGVTARFLDAGHVAGSAQILINWEGVRVLYTGDICMFENRMSGRFQTWGEVDILVSESTYGSNFGEFGGSGHNLRELGRLTEEMRRVLKGGGRVLIPTYATKAPEIMNAIAEARETGRLPPVPCYSVGLHNALLDLLAEVFPEEVAKIRRHFSLRSLPRPEMAEENEEFEREILESNRPCVILCTPGDLREGVSSNLAVRVLQEERSAIFLIGFQDEEAPGRAFAGLRRGGKFRVSEGRELPVRCRVARFNIRSHARPEDITGAILNSGAKLVVFVHGDREAERRLKEEVRARAPRLRAYYFTPEKKIEFDRTGRFEPGDLPPERLGGTGRPFVVEGILEELPDREGFAETTREGGGSWENQSAWAVAKLKAAFIQEGLRAENVHLALGRRTHFPALVRLVVRGDRGKIEEVAGRILRGATVRERLADSKRIPLEGAAEFEGILEWLRACGHDLDMPHPYFQSWTGGTYGKFTPPNRVLINPLHTEGDGWLRRAALCHEIAHYLLHRGRGSSPRDECFVEGAAEYVAWKRTGRMCIEGRVGEDGVYYPDSSDNPYVRGWYMFKCVDSALGEREAVRIMLRGDRRELERAFKSVRERTRGMAAKLAEGVGRLYVRAAPRGVVGSAEVTLLYDPPAAEGRLYIAADGAGEEVWVVRNLRERGGLLYRLARLLRIVRRPWLECDFVERTGERREDFLYKVPEGEGLREVGVFELHALPPEGCGGEVAGHV